MLSTAVSAKLLWYNCLLLLKLPLDLLCSLATKYDKLNVDHKQAHHLAECSVVMGLQYCIDIAK